MMILTRSRELKRRVLLLSSLVLLIFLCLRYYQAQAIPHDAAQRVSDKAQPPSDFQNDNVTDASRKGEEAIGQEQHPAKPKPIIDLAALALPEEDALQTYHTISSSNSSDGHYFSVSFGPGENNTILNPNIIPNPGQPGTWIVVAQQRDGGPHLISIELVCVTSFRDGALRCLPESPAVVLPIRVTPGGNCPEKIGYLNWAQGPHDARVFNGPDGPLVIFGSNSAFTCFGLFIQDLRQLVEWPVDVKAANKSAFAKGTEMQRPDPWGVMEKNWFVFWDRQGAMYAHFDIFPQRAFARLHPDGSVEEDLAPKALEGDEKCIGTYLPSNLGEHESIHQGTNALAVTLCRRADPGCKAESENTFVFTIVQHKTYFSFHSEYYPYVVLFSQNAPFGLYGISSKPLWIDGRQQFENGTTSMVYVASVNWKAEGLGYHGYLDDTLFLGFGIEDRESGGMDILASDLLAGLGLCSDI